MVTLKNVLRVLGALLVAAVSPNAARANFLDLADGTYNVTLNCTFSSVIACPSTIGGTMTISGVDVTFMDFTVNGQLFSGDPTEGTFTSLPLADYEFANITLSPFSFLSIRNDLSVSFGPADHWWVYCNNVDDTHCTPATDGDWTATLVATPEPMTLGLFAGALAGVGIARRARKRTV